MGLGSITDMYIQGLIEAKANDQNDIDLKLSRIHSSEFRDPEGFVGVLQMNKSNVKFLTRSQLECEPLPDTLKPIMYWKEGVCFLDVSSFRNLENLCTYNILPKTSIQLDKLKVLELSGECDVLDLSFYPNLESVILCDGIALLPNAFHGLAQLKRLKLENCKCEMLDLSSCLNLESLELLGEITLQSNDLHSLVFLQNIDLNECLCVGLDLSSCQNLEMIKLFGRITLQPTALTGLALLTHLDLTGECVCDQLDLSLCCNLEEIIVGGSLLLLPDGFHRLDELKKLRINGESRCQALDLRSCHNLEFISVEGATSILQNGLCGLTKLNDLTYKTRSLDLELLSCQNLEHSNVSGNIAKRLSEELALHNNTYCSVENLTHLTLDRCRCEVFDFSSCISLEKLHLEGEITLRPQGLLNLKNLKHLILNCFCDGLDLSTCYNLKNVSIWGNIDLPPSRKRAGEDFVNTYYNNTWNIDTEQHCVNTCITLASTGLHECANLESLHLLCKCNSLDLSMLANLKYLELGSGIKLRPKKLPTLTGIEVLILWTECEDLDLSLCKQLHSLYIGENLALLPDGLRGLHNLSHIFITGHCGGLDLSSCINIRYIFVGKQVNLKTTDLRKHDNLHHLTLCCKCDSLDLSECHELLTLCLTESMTVSLSSLSERMLLLRSHEWQQCRSSCYNYLQELCLIEPVHLSPHSLSSLKFVKHLTLGGNCKGIDVSLCSRLKTFTLIKPVCISLGILIFFPKLKRLTVKPSFDVFTLSNTTIGKLNNVKDW
ncbi:hypothetical protein DPMN_101164 [Dreissena polymorpha]|uniref:Uncharacterized protein n=1 Tax=Dreissena polymorpha TaxID=45954 RepID=A0A9D4R8V4_DREPO|nr:hypothetical protein DPMN_101164 [Dreissena polymorpha]